MTVITLPINSFSVLLSLLKLPAAFHTVTSKLKVQLKCCKAAQPLVERFKCLMYVMPPQFFLLCVDIEISEMQQIKNKLCKLEFYC